MTGGTVASITCSLPDVTHPDADDAAVAAAAAAALLVSADHKPHNRLNLHGPAMHN